MALTCNRIALIISAMVIFFIYPLYLGSGEQKAMAETEQPRYYYKNLLLLPIKNAADIFGEGQTGKCAICGSSFMTGPVSASAVSIITAHIKSELYDRTNVIDISEEQYQDMRNRILLFKKKEMTELEVISNIAEEMGADAVLAGNIYRFQERVGSDYAAETPASVALELDLIETKNAVIRWTRRYDDTQRALSDNLLNN